MHHSRSPGGGGHDKTIARQTDIACVFSERGEMDASQACSLARGERREERVQGCGAMCGMCGMCAVGCVANLLLGEDLVLEDHGSDRWGHDLDRALKRRQPPRSREAVLSLW